MPAKFKFADDPLLRQSQLLLEKSRRLREQSLGAPTSVDQAPGCSTPNTSNDAMPPFGAPSTSDSDILASFGNLAAASATAAARLNAARISAASAPPAPTTTPSAPRPVPTAVTLNGASASATCGVNSSATSAALAVTGGVAAAAAAAAVAPPAAQAASAAAASAALASAAASSWLAIEELLEEAAYSLSQELPGGRGTSPLDALIASSTAGGSSLALPPSSKLAALARPADPLSLPLPSGGSLEVDLEAAGSLVAAVPDALAAVPGALAAVPGATRISDMLDDLLYSLSQDISLAATGDAVASAAAAAAAGLAEAAAELPRAAAAVYRSAADAAATAAAARAATRGFVGSSSGYILPEGVEPPAPGDPGWDPYGTIRAALGLRAEGPAPSDLEGVIEAAVAEAATAAPAASSASVASAAATAAPALPAAGDAVAAASSSAAAAAVAPPVITSPAATSVADAATATAAAVVQAATTAAAGTVVIPAPVVPPAPAAQPAAAAAVATAPSAPPSAVTVPPEPSAVAPAPPPPVEAPAPAFATAQAPAAPVPTPEAAAPLPSVKEPVLEVPAAPEPVAAIDSAAAVSPPVVNSVAEAEHDLSAPPQPPPVELPEPAGDVLAATTTTMGADSFGPPEVEVAGGLLAGDGEELDQLTAALQNLLAVDDLSGLDAASAALTTDPAAAASAAVASLGLPPPDEEAVAALSEALRRELSAVVVDPDVLDSADPSALADAAGQAVGAALSAATSSGALDLSSLPPDARLSSLLAATLQSAVDLVEAALGGLGGLDSTLLGGVTIAAVLALLLRAVVSMAGTAINRGRDVAASSLAAVATADSSSSGASSLAGSSGSSLRAVGVTALEAAAALNNDVKAILLDIRNGSDVQDQGLPDLRPFRRGAGLTPASLPYCDFRTAPTLANPSGLLGGGRNGGSATGTTATATALAPTAAVTVSVDPLFCSRFKQLPGLDRDSRVFLIDSYGVEAPEAVLLLRSDPEIERLLGSQGIQFVEGGFAGPEGWKLTGLPTADPPALDSSDPSASARQQSGLRGLDLNGLMGGVAGLRLRYPSLFSRTLAVGAVGGAGVAVASNLDWGAVSRGAVGLAASMLLADRALPQGVRPSGKIREYLQAQMTEPQTWGDATANNGADAAARRRRTALLLRALDLAEAVGDAVVRAGGAAVAAAGSAARSAMEAASAAPPAPSAPPALAPPAETTVAAAAPVASTVAAADAAASALEEAALALEEEAPPPPPVATAAANAVNIVLPLGMDSPQWGQAAEAAAASGAAVQPPPLGRSGSPVVRTGRSRSPTAAAASAAPIPPSQQPTTEPASELLPPRSPSPSLAGRLGSAIRSAADAVVRAASPSRGGDGSRELAPPAAPPAPRSPSPGVSGGSKGPDTMELMAALATASALSNTTLPGAGVGDSALPAGWPASAFPRASAGQGTSPAASMDEEGAVATAGDEVNKFQVPLAAEEALEEQERSLFQELQRQEEEEMRRLAEEQARVDAALAAAAAALGEVVVESAPATGSVAPSANSAASAWANWRQELDVAPPPPAVEALRQQQPSRSPATGSMDEVPEAAPGGGSASVAASRLGGARGGLSPGGRRGSGNSSGSSSSSRGQRRPLRTASPERAAAAGAAMRKLRMELAARDDDGLSSGIFGGVADLYGGNNSEDEDAPPPAAVQYKSTADPALAAAAAGAVTAVSLEGRSGSAGQAAARLARGTGGLSPGRARRQIAAAAAAAANGSGDGSVSASTRRRQQPLRTASPERAAAAAAAMRQLRLEMGLPPNDGSDLDRAPPIAVAPRDWRRELEAAAEVPEHHEETHEAEAAAAPVPVAEAAAPKVAVAAAPAPVRVSHSPRNWRSPANSAVHAPSDWRARIEEGATNAAAASVAAERERELVGAGVGAGRPLRTASSPGRAKMSAAERAERDARLQDWRARV